MINNEVTALLLACLVVCTIYGKYKMKVLLVFLLSDNWTACIEFITQLF